LASVGTLQITIDPRSLTLKGAKGETLTAKLPDLSVELLEDAACLAVPTDANPPGEDELAKRVAALRDRLLNAGGPEILAQSMGARLFELIFPNQRFVEAYHSARDAAGCLRLALEFALDSTDSDSPVSRWAALPWEYLRDPGSGHYLVLLPDCRLVRRLGPGEVGPFRAESPLHVLATFAEPWNEPPYGRDEALRALTEGIAPGGNVRVTVEPQPTFSALVQALAEHHPHVLHIVCHGSYPGGTEGTLALENDYGGSDSVPADKFAAQVAGSGVGLVVLVACFSGSGAGVQDFRGVAQALLRAGVPAVLAMQYAEPVASGHRLSAVLYRALDRGTPLDEAMGIVRRTLSAASPSVYPLDWAIPVLYMQTDQWDMAPRSGAGAQPQVVMAQPPRTNLGDVTTVRPTTLYGRGDKLIELARAMREPLQRRRFVTVTGTGGIGKTALALESAHWHQDRGDFPDGVFWASAKDVPSYPQLLSNVGQAVGIADAERMSPPLLEQALLDALKRVRLLLVIDNAESFREHKPFLDLLGRIDPSPAGCLLLTSRRRMEVDGESVVDLVRLPLEAAVALFMHGWSPDRLSEAEVKNAAAICGPSLLNGHPFAIVLAAAVARKEHQASLSELRQRLKDNMLGVLRDRKTRDQEDSLEASLGLSFNALSGTAQAVLVRASIFEAPFRMEAVEAVAGELGGWRQALVELMDHHLLDKADTMASDGATVELYIVHPVVRAYGLAMVPDTKGLHLAAGRYLAGTSYAQEIVEGIRHLEAVQAWPEVIAGAERIVRYLDTAGMWAEDEAVLQAALRAARALGSKKDIGYALGELGSNHLRMGDARGAIEHYQQALAIHRETGDHKGEGAALGNLGLAYADLGDVPRAIEHYQQALAIARDIGDRQGEGNHLGNLGNAYARLGQVPRAIEHFQQALDIAREIGDRRGEGSRLGNLGNAYAALGEVPKAIEHYTQALAIAREIGDRQGEGNHLGNLGSAYAALGEVPKAIEHYTQALAIHREIGDRHGEGNHLENLGSAYFRLGEMPQAIEHYQQALAIARDIGDRQGEGNRLGNLGLAYARLGQVPRAIEHFQQALAIARDIGDRHGEGAALGNLGLAYLEMEDAEAALRHLLPGFLILQRIGSPDAKRAVGSMARLQEKLGERKFQALLTRVAQELGLPLPAEPPQPPPP